jgi:hypothetical protein
LRSELSELDNAVLRMPSCAESLRVLRAVVVESADVETAIDAHIVVDFETTTPNSAAADNERGRL